jgi:hypothetical protein
MLALTVCTDMLMLQDKTSGVGKALDTHTGGLSDGAFNFGAGVTNFLLIRKQACAKQSDN